MKKPILSGLCLILNYLCFSQAFSNFSNFNNTILCQTIEQFLLNEHNLNAQTSFQSQWSTITDHPYYLNFELSYIPDFGNESKPEASISINSTVYGPFRNIGSAFSLGVLKSIERNKFGYRGGIQLGYEISQLNINHLIWSDPSSETGYYSGNNSFGLGYYLGGWYTASTYKSKNIFIFTFESSNQLSINISGEKAGFHPFAGRYSLNYQFIQEDSRFSALFKMDLDIRNRAIQLLEFQYYFPFNMYGGVLGTSTKAAGFTAGYYWRINNYWDTSFDISYQYIHSFEEYGYSVGDSHQITLRCSGIF